MVGVTAVRKSSDAAGVGVEMHDLMADLFPICRSLTGDGVRRSLDILRRVAPIERHEVQSGTRCYDWVVPDEWTVRDAWVKDASGRRVIDFRRHNLHLVGYSVPFAGEMSRDTLAPYLHTRPDLPDAIPYVTSYYAPRWGFCLADQDCRALPDGPFEVRVDTALAPGSLTYGEILIPGESDDEVLLATNICHPSMANNELSGPVLTATLARWLLSAPRRLSYRLVFVPETIGAIAYLSVNSDAMKANTIAGFQVVCVGGPADFTYLETRLGNTLTDRLARHVLEGAGIAHRVLDYRHRASDERQWCSPGIDLPVGSLMRSKYQDYPEYHSSKDDLDFVRPEHLEQSFNLYVRCLEALESGCPGLPAANPAPALDQPTGVLYAGTLDGCEPNLGRRGLYPTLGGRSHQAADATLLLDVLAYCDGDHDLASIAGRLERPLEDVEAAAAVLVGEELLTAVD
jgi:aminopeptidase-like protein